MFRTLSQMRYSKPKQLRLNYVLSSWETRNGRKFGTSYRLANSDLYSLLKWPIRKTETLNCIAMDMSQHSAGFSALHPPLQTRGRMLKVFDKCQTSTLTLIKNMSIHKTNETSPVQKDIIARSFPNTFGVIFKASTCCASFVPWIYHEIAWSSDAAPLLVFTCSTGGLPSVFELL